MGGVASTSRMRTLLFIALAGTVGCRGNGPEAQAFGQRYADHVLRGEYAEARELGALSFQRKYPGPRFQEIFEAERPNMTASAAHSLEVRVPEQHQGYMPRTQSWRVSAELSKPGTDPPLVLVMILVEQETEAPAFWVVDAHFSRRAEAPVEGIAPQSRASRGRP